MLDSSESNFLSTLGSEPDPNLTSLLNHLPTGRPPALLPIGVVALQIYVLEHARSTANHPLPVSPLHLSLSLSVYLANLGVPEGKASPVQLLLPVGESEWFNISKVQCRKKAPHYFNGQNQATVHL